MIERLQKLIAHSGLTSRRGSEEMIIEGRVTVNGVAAHLGQKIDPETALVEVDGVPLPVAPGLVYFLLNKPLGVISTAEDTHGRPTVVAMVPTETRVYPVGRLDSDSEGLIVLTNDGILTERLTHPRYGVHKTYLVRVRGNATRVRVRRLRGGVELEDGLARPVSVRVVDRLEEEALLEIVLTEGRNREVRRMCDAVDLPVVRLVRTAIGPLSDHTLKPGNSRPLGIEEVRSLYAATER
ncbi:MAG: pseudouridine synthase [Acidimicrobiia bacterium]